MWDTSEKIARVTIWSQYTRIWIFQIRRPIEIKNEGTVTGSYRPRVATTSAREMIVPQDFKRMPMLNWAHIWLARELSHRVKRNNIIFQMDKTSKNIAPMETCVMLKKPMFITSKMGRALVKGLASRTIIGRSLCSRALRSCLKDQGGLIPPVVQINGLVKSTPSRWLSNLQPNKLRCL